MLLFGLERIFRLLTLGLFVASDYLPVATGGGANVDSQVNFASSTYQPNGFTAGVAQSIQMNKVWRQSSMVAAAVTNFIVNMLGINIADDGNLAGLITNLTNAIRRAANTLVVVVFSSTPTFDLNLGNVFEITLTGNVTSSTLANLVFGAPLTLEITFIIHQDGAGGHTFVAPAAVPLGAISPLANKTTMQSFKVGNAGALYPTGGPTVI